MDEKDGTFSPRTRKMGTQETSLIPSVDNAAGIRRRVTLHVASWKSSNIKLNMAWPLPPVDKFDGRAESRKMERQGSSKIQRAGSCVVGHLRGWLQRRPVYPTRRWN
jgi:hypothetical protein